MTMAWSARWLQSTLRKHLDGRQVIVVSNREPCVHEIGDDGGVVTKHPISGLVTALDPLLRAAGGTWIAHVDRHGRSRRGRSVRSAAGRG